MMRAAEIVASEVASPLILIVEDEVIVAKDIVDSVGAEPRREGKARAGRVVGLRNRRARGYEEAARFKTPRAKRRSTLRK